MNRKPQTHRAWTLGIRLAKMNESADKPGFVVNSHLSRVGVTTYLKRPTRISNVGSTCAIAHGFLFGLAPGGVYRATDVTTSAVRSYRTLSPLPSIN